MVEAILKDKKRILPCCVWLEGEYGLKGTMVGVPVILGGGGVEKIIEVQLTDADRKALHTSAGHVKEMLDKVKV